MMRSRMSVFPVVSDIWVGSLVLMIERLLLLRMSCSAIPLEFVLLQKKLMCLAFRSPMINEWLWVEMAVNKAGDGLIPGGQ